MAVLDEAKLKVEINNTALAAPNKIKAIADLHTCIGTNNKDVTALVDIIADIRPIATGILFLLLLLLLPIANVVV